MEFTTHLELHSQATRLCGSAPSLLCTHGAVTLSGPAFEARVGRGGRLQCGPSRLQFPKDYQVELFPLHSPLLRESLLVSFPPLSYMLKFSGSSYVISGQECGGCAPREPHEGARARTRRAAVTRPWLGGGATLRSRQSRSVWSGGAAVAGVLSLRPSCDVRESTTTPRCCNPPERGASRGAGRHRASRTRIALQAPRRAPERARGLGAQTPRQPGGAREGV